MLGQEQRFRNRPVVLHLARSLIQTRSLAGNAPKHPLTSALAYKRVACISCSVSFVMKKRSRCALFSLLLAVFFAAHCPSRRRRAPKTRLLLQGSRGATR